MSRLGTELENVRTAVGEASRRSSADAPADAPAGAPILGTFLGGLVRAPSALAAQAAALKAIQRMLEELKDAVEALQRTEEGRI